MKAYLITEEFLLNELRKQMGDKPFCPQVGIGYWRKERLFDATATGHGGGPCSGNGCTKFGEITEQGHCKSDLQKGWKIKWWIHPYWTGNFEKRVGRVVDVGGCEIDVKSKHGKEEISRNQIYKWWDCKGKCYKQYPWGVLTENEAVETTWDEVRKKGMSDADILTYISYRWGMSGGSSHSWYKGGNNPAFWASPRLVNFYGKKPHFAGKYLIESVRNVLDMTYPKMRIPKHG